MKKTLFVLLTMTSMLSAESQLEKKSSGREQSDEEVAIQPVEDPNSKQNSGGDSQWKKRKFICRNAMTAAEIAEANKK